MGTFAGHLVPGLALASLGLWHTINTIHVYFLKGSNTFIIRFWYPLRKLQYLELILVFSFSIFAILAQILDIHHLRFHFELDNIEHATIFLQLLIFTTFTFLSDFANLSPNMIGVSGILVASIFGQELFLLHYHSTDHIGLEGHYHFLMQLIVCVSFLASLCATAAPSSFPAALILSISVVFQGCWFINMGFVLWVPDFVPRGCASATQGMHGAVVCGSHEEDLRARAFANLQFCWIFSSILVLTVSVCMLFGRLRAQTRQSVEYEQLCLSSPAVGFKQIQL